MPTLRATSICIVFSTIVLSAIAFAQDPPSPFPILGEGAKSGKLGSYLEGLFQRQLGICLTGSPTPRKLTVTKSTLGGIGTTSKDLSAIPPALRDPSLKPNGDVVIGFDASVGRTFAYIYPSKSLVIQSPDVNNYLIA